MPGMLDMASTPPGYQTPQQVQQMYDQSAAYTKGGMRDAPITSPWQGARMMADALSGNVMRNRAGQQQMGGLNSGASQQLGMAQPPGAPQGQPSMAPSQTPGSFSTPTPPASQPPITHPTPMPTPPLQMGGGSPVPSPGITGSGMPGQPMSAGIQPQMGGMGGNPGMPQNGQNPMMSALMSKPPGMGGMSPMGMMG